MNTPWKYTENTFDVVTKGSFKLMLILSTDHFARCNQLSSEQPANQLITDALQDATMTKGQYLSAYSAWDTCRGLYKGATQAFYEELVTLASLKIRQWDAAVQAVYLEGTSEYTTIFPSGRAVFQKGALDLRVTAVKNLSLVLLNYPGLAALQSQVATYFISLEGLRLAQQQRETEVDTCSATLELQRVATAKVMYKNLARFMLVWWDTPVRIEDGFDMNYIRDGAPPPPDDDPAPIPPPPVP